MASVNDAFAQLLSNLEPSQTLQDAVTTHHNAVRSYIENNLTDASTKLIGSLQRRTRIHPRTDDKFDIDILLILGGFNKWVVAGGVSPTDALTQANTVLNESTRYQEMEPTIDHPTVTMDYADGINVEIVPAYIDNIGHDAAGNPCPPVGRGYWIPYQGRWVHADYDHDAEMVTAGNDNTDGRLVPTIKMLKAIKREHFPQMKSFHLEILASLIIPAILKTFAQNAVVPTHPMVLHQFFLIAKDLLGTEVCFIGSNTPKTCLGLFESSPVKEKFTALANAIGQINAMASESAQVDGWRIVFGDVFPAS